MPKSRHRKNHKKKVEAWKQKTKQKINSANKEIRERASKIVHGEEGKIRPLSATASDRAITLLGHIIRASPDDQMRKIAVDAEFKRVEKLKRRVGRPRFYWLQTTMERAHKLLLKHRSMGKKNSALTI